MLSLDLFCASVSKMCLKVSKESNRGDFWECSKRFPRKLIVIANFTLCHFCLQKVSQACSNFWRVEGICMISGGEEKGFKDGVL